MRSTRTPTLWLRFAWALLIMVFFGSATLTQAQGSTGARPHQTAVGLAQFDGVLSQGDGSVTLVDMALPSPAVLSDVDRYGTLTSEQLFFAQPVTRLQLTYAAQSPSGSAVRVDVRGSLDGQRWQPWVVDLSSGDVIDFRQPIKYAQYRLTLTGNQFSAPVVREVRLELTSSAASVEATPADPYAVAPTFRVRATRQGMVGGRTANGYIIPPNARFVSLPSWSALSSRGGNEYQVRLTYRGRSTVVPVYDVGPYNTRDDYWATQRTGFPDLQWGWSMDHAAYYDGYNNGRAEKGYVRFPTAVDVGDGAWIQDLGIVGDQAEVEVTFLWMGQDPANGRPLRNPEASEHLVDELDGDFWSNTPLLSASAMRCGANLHAYWSRTTANPENATVVRWQPNVPIEAAYDLFVHVPVCPQRLPATTTAAYIVGHRDGVTEIVVNQRSQTGWVHLGQFPFAAGDQGYVQLGAVASDGGITWFDQVRWVPVR
ncbi:hypothetical protein [Candidatus Chloroploca sp. Khr17]|uniref:golvesin C-terminal-like domain-containing protein n=1 Tax=Candidatus Chloroploca sp. Khr17 TaxID=2496869 RepID=UPI00101BD98E|nr:hypothetical protein [Candidatus Chloroploca sp. Khr17]